MQFWPESPVLYHNPATKKVLVGHLKRCPLCDALNSEESKTCFVCTWHGDFDRDPDHVEASLDELILRCPELVDAMIIEAAIPLPMHVRLMRGCSNAVHWVKNLLPNVRLALRKRRSRRIDFKA